MPGDVTTSVTAVVSVVDKATPAIDTITKSLKQVDAVAQQVGEHMPQNIDALLQRVAAGQRSLDEINKDVARSVDEQRRQFEAAGLLKPPPALKLPEVPPIAAPKVPDIAPVIEKQVEQINAAAEKLEQPLAGIGDKLRAALSRTFSDLGKQAGALGAAIKARVGGAFTGLVGLFEGVAGRLKGIFAGLGGFLAGAGLAEAIRIATAGLDEFAKTAQRLGEQARVLGIPVEQLQELQRWAREANLPLNELEKNLARLTRTIGEVAAGKNKKAGELFEELNVALTDAAGQARPTADVLRDIAAAMASMTSDAERARVGFALFGRNWESMVDALRAGPEAIDAAAQAQQQLGVITGQQVQQVQEYQKALRGVGEQWRGIGADFRASLGEVLLPVLTPVLQQLEAWLKVNREWLKMGLKEAVEGIAAAFQQLGAVIGSTGDDIKAFAGLVEPVATLLKDVWKGLELPDISLPTDPITAFRDTVFGFLRDWLDRLVGIKAAWEAIAAAIKTVAEAWTALTGTAWDQPRPPTMPPGVAWEQPRAAGPPPTAVSTGGGPLTWETLGGPQPGGLIGPAAGGQPPQGTVNVVIENKNPPPGTRTTAKAAGPGVSVDVGQSMPWTAPAYGGPWAPAGA